MQGENERYTLLLVNSTSSWNGRGKSREMFVNVKMNESARWDKREAMDTFVDGWIL